MLPVFEQYLDNYYVSISGMWCLTLRDVREKLLRGKKPSLLETSIPKKEPILVDMYKLSLKLPEAPFANRAEVNSYIETQGRLVVIACFDWLKEELNWEKIVDEPDIIKLFKCIRDASAHNNYFNLKDKRFLPLQWQNKTLTIDDDNKQFFSRWMALGDIEYFLEDVSVEVKNRINS